MVADDAGLHLGERLAAGEAEAARVALHGPPLGQLDRGPSARRRSTRRSRTRAGPARRCTFRPTRLGDRAPPSPGCARAATRRRRRPSGSAAMRAATASACSRPSSARCRPGARPGQRLAGRRRLAVADEQHERGGGGLRRGRHAAPVSHDRRSTYRGPRWTPLAARRRAEIVACRACPRLVAWREQVAAEKRAAFRDEDYWGRPVPGFGDPAARVAGRRAGAGRARRQPHRPGVHRRPLGRLAVPRRCTGPASPTSRRARSRDDGLRLTRRLRSPPPCAARRRPTSRRPTSATPCRAVPRARAGAAADAAGVRRASAQFAYDGRGRACSACGPGRGSATASRSRRRTAARSLVLVTTRASRTPSPASSPSRCSTPSSRAPAAGSLERRRSALHGCACT